MGQDIHQDKFTAEEFAEFRVRLQQETLLLQEWFQAGRLATDTPMAGFELEAWLVQKNGNPAPVNEVFLADLDDPLVVPELSTFNVELNTHPLVLRGNCFSRLHEQLQTLWTRCSRAAVAHDVDMAMIGILPSVQPSDLCLENISSQVRYQALNEQILLLRNGRPIELDIQGRDRLQLSHNDVMLEAATTSFQIHFKVDGSRAAKAFNMAKILSAPMVAVSANSPFLFSQDLWDETRIPLFEQAVSVGESDYSKRVTFGIRYAERHIMECFEANRDRYPVLLPQLSDDPPESLAHLRLHNGTIWRWNRPLVDFNDNGEPHVRIEHRVVPSGPTVADEVANAAFYFGLVTAYMQENERQLPFENARDNFYQAAKSSLNASVYWLDGKKHQITELIDQQLLPMAEKGLRTLAIDEHEITHWLEIVRQRVQSRQTGASWQRQYFYKHGQDYQKLVLAYLENQQSGHPVHRWEI